MATKYVDDSLIDRIKDDIIPESPTEEGYILTSNGTSTEWKPKYDNLTEANKNKFLMNTGDGVEWTNISTGSFDEDTTAVTQPSGTSDDTIATTAFVAEAIAAKTFTLVCTGTEGDYVIQ